MNEARIGLMSTGGLQVETARVKRDALAYHNSHLICENERDAGLDESH